jgi:hypothetical protein
MLLVAQRAFGYPSRKAHTRRQMASPQLHQRSVPDSACTQKSKTSLLCSDCSAAQVQRADRLSGTGQIPERSRGENRAEGDDSGVVSASLVVCAQPRVNLDHGDCRNGCSAARRRREDGRHRGRTALSRSLWCRYACFRPHLYHFHCAHLPSKDNRLHTLGIFPAAALSTTSEKERGVLS